MIWHGGQPRAEAMRLAADGDIGLSWRHPELDASLELSTKVLEFGQLGPAGHPQPDADARGAARRGLPAVRRVTRRRGRRGGLGARPVPCSPWRRRGRRRRPRRSPSTGRPSGCATYLARAVSPAAPAGSSAGAPLRVVIAGHDLKFFNSLIHYFRLQPDLEVRVDQWAALGEHDESKSRELAEWADVVICEWCGTERRLVLAAQAALGAAPGRTCTGSSCTRPTRRRSRSATSTGSSACPATTRGSPGRSPAGQAAKVVTVPNPLDVLQLDRPKLDGARFNLGMISVGGVPQAPRPGPGRA